jgi:hypothetical protein
MLAVLAEAGMGVLTIIIPDIYREARLLEIEAITLDGQPPASYVLARWSPAAPARAFSSEPGPGRTSTSVARIGCPQTEQCSSTWPIRPQAWCRSSGCHTGDLA